MQAAAETHAETIATHAASIAARDAELSDLRSELSRKQEQIHLLESSAADGAMLEATVGELEAELEARGAQIAASSVLETQLRDQIAAGSADAEADRADFETQLGERDSRIEALTADVAVVVEELTTLRAKCADLEVELATLTLESALAQRDDDDDEVLPPQPIDVVHHDVATDAPRWTVNATVGTDDDLQPPPPSPSLPQLPVTVETGTGPDPPKPEQVSRSTATTEEPPPVKKEADDEQQQQQQQQENDNHKVERQLREWMERELETERLTSAELRRAANAHESEVLRLRDRLEVERLTAAELRHTIIALESEVDRLRSRGVESEIMVSAESDRLRDRLETERTTSAELQRTVITLESEVQRLRDRLETERSILASVQSAAVASASSLYLSAPIRGDAAVITSLRAHLRHEQGRTQALESELTATRGQLRRLRTAIAGESSGINSNKHLLDRSNHLAMTWWDENNSSVVKTNNAAIDANNVTGGGLALSPRRTRHSLSPAQDLSRFMAAVRRSSRTPPQPATSKASPSSPVLTTTAAASAFASDVSPRAASTPAGPRAWKY
jgi:chromosome segregation ATPase